MENDQNWFREWFNSPYYHLLYSNRNFSEAEKFIHNLLKELNLSTGQDVLDLACGKGRHSLSFNQNGLNVVGLDLSSESIYEAKKLENETLKFLIGDMRNFKIEHQFDAIFNLFTSFGYFKNSAENQLVIDNVAKHLKDEGVFVIDYLNASKVSINLPISETIHREGIDFNINKSLTKGFIVKEIQFKDQNKTYSYKEYVKYIDLQDFSSYINHSGLKIESIFGDYDLSAFDEKLSDRLIILATKK